MASAPLEGRKKPGRIRNPSSKPDTIITAGQRDRDSSSESDDVSEGSDFVLELDESTIVPAQHGKTAVALQSARKKKRRRTKRSSVKELVRAADPSPEDEIKTKILVRRARIAFESLRCHYLLEQIKNPTSSSSKSFRFRPDLKALSAMNGLEMLNFLSPDRRIMGPIPGIEIGDIFFFRAELLILGLHGNVQAGISYLPAGFTGEDKPLALSVVESGGYQNDKELGEGLFLYTGHGGKGVNDVHITSDQTLERGNLALERSHFYSTEIRVIRGIQLNYSKRIYVYDGLYKVIEYYKTKESGFDVYQFKLLRNKDQKESGLKRILIAKEMKAKLAEAMAEGTVPSGYQSRDLSEGKERIPVPFWNDIDRNDLRLRSQYVNSPKYPSLSIKSAKERGCECKTACSAKCKCRERNNGTFAYDEYSSLLLQGRPIIYECGDNCNCPPNCTNRVTQKGLRYQLEVYRSRETDWGVRSLDPIQAGTFICEFGGDVVLRESVPEQYRTGFGLIDPKSFQQQWKGWGNLSEIFPEWKMTDSPSLEEEPGYFLDVSRRCNVACYVSDNAAPNTFVQFVLFAHDQVRFPRLMVFALENIPPFKPLSLDYGSEYR